MVDLNVLLDYVEISVVAICFLVGYVVKNYTKIPNKHITAIVLVLGVVSNVLITICNKDPFTLSVIISGGFSGLASTGFYEFIVNLLGLKKDKIDVDETGET